MQLVLSLAFAALVLGTPMPPRDTWGRNIEALRPRDSQLEPVYVDLGDISVEVETRDSQLEPVYVDLGEDSMEVEARDS
ncbi:hypothetical protein LTR36_008484 [Oleoguttula mirabilis]|uniref:Uncharacterized protein n=1 Tax=Oleoguttula mirabilis TaxID=1507867 RepID=A0AAV9JTD2_9PEZI|nr:hypothetical protein LTR36_008484 [Oleoguttula mirabilis]